jgi:hypothetical protein
VTAEQPSSTFGDQLSPRTAAQVAWGICAAYWVAISVGYALRLSHGTEFHVLDELGSRIGYGSCATVGAVIISRHPRNVIGWILCAVGLTSAVAGFAQDYASYALLDRPERKRWRPVPSWSSC